MTRAFYLVRDTDVTGVSGTGIVAEGIEFSDGTCAMRWRTDTASTATYSSIADIEAIHGHGGSTRIAFLSTLLQATAAPEPRHAATDPEPESNLVAHARTELALLGDTDDPATDRMSEHLLAMVRTFAAAGHSGGSAAWAIAALNKLLRYEPLAPLTGAPGEWNDLGEGMFQNRRCSRVFWDTSDPSNRPYDVEGRVFVEPDGSAYTSADSRTEVTFPYVPHTERIQVPAPSTPDGETPVDNQEPAS